MTRWRAYSPPTSPVSDMDNGFATLSAPLIDALLEQYADDEAQAEQAAVAAATPRDGSVYYHHPPSPKQAQFLSDEADTHLEVMYGGGVGGGKAGRCPDRASLSYNEDMETKVLTPKGFKLLGDIRVGDQVCNPDGTVARVIAVHERGEQEFYRVTLSDGASVEASADHKWVMSLAGRRRRTKQAAPVVPVGLRLEDEWNLRVMQRCTVVTTRNLAEIIAGCAVTGAKGARVNAPQFPLTAPVNMTGVQGRWATLPPYTLGALIGDGHLGDRGVIITTEDPGIIDRMRLEVGDVFRISLIPNAGLPRANAYRIAGAVGQKSGSPQDLLRRDGLLGMNAHEKFIPARVKIAPVAIRRAFIQGLFDTDGYMDDRGHIEFVTVSERLIHDVRWVLRSLGYKATLSTKQPHFTHKGERREGRLAYRLYVRGPHQELLFGLPRKADRARQFNGGDVWPSHRVVSVEPSGRDNARCITVDHPNGLYITDDFIVTHNSDALLMGALKYVHVPRYAALLLRRTFSDLMMTGALMDRADTWLRPTDAHWSGPKMRWEFPSGATITFGYLEKEMDKFRYASAELQYIGMDELTGFTRSQYTFMISRLRRLKGHKVPIRMRSATNPIGPGVEWVKQRFLDEGPAHGRLFIPALMADNPGLDIEEYEKTLEELDPITAAQLRYGDWDVRADGEMFQRADFQIEDPADLPTFPHGQLVRYWDLAATQEQRPERGFATNDPDYTVGVLMGRDGTQSEAGDFWIADVIRERLDPGAVEQLVLQTARLDGKYVKVRIQQDPGSAGKALIARFVALLAGFDVEGDRVSGPKEVRVRPLAAQTKAHRLHLVRAAWTPAFLDECVSYPSRGIHDDQPDAAAGAMDMLTDQTAHPFGYMTRNPEFRARVLGPRLVPGGAPSAPPVIELPAAGVAS